MRESRLAQVQCRAGQGSFLRCDARCSAAPCGAALCCAALCGAALCGAARCRPYGWVVVEEVRRRLEQREEVWREHLTRVCACVCACARYVCAVCALARAMHTAAGSLAAQHTMSSSRKMACECSRDVNTCRDRSGEPQRKRSRRRFVCFEGAREQPLRKFTFASRSFGRAICSRPCAGPAPALRRRCAGTRAAARTAKRPRDERVIAQAAREPPAQRPPGWGPPLPTSAPGPGSPPPHLHRDRARRCHICAGTGPAREGPTCSIAHL
jgi:hypothetical protein